MRPAQISGGATAAATAPLVCSSLPIQSLHHALENLGSLVRPELSVGAESQFVENLQVLGGAQCPPCLPVPHAKGIKKSRIERTGELQRGRTCAARTSINSTSESSDGWKRLFCEADYEGSSGHKLMVNLAAVNQKRAVAHFLFVQNISAKSRNRSGLRSVLKFAIRSDKTLPAVPLLSGLSVTGSTG